MTNRDHNSIYNSHAKSHSGRAMFMYDEVYNMNDESMTILHVGTETQQISGIHDNLILQLIRQSNDELQSRAGEYDDSEQLNVIRAKEASRRRMYRQVLKSQREELRQQVAHLSHEVSQLKQTKEMEKAKFDAEQTSEFWFWKSTAAQQHHKRMLVEREHEALKRAVDIQTTYIKSLEVVRQERSGSTVNYMRLHLNECLDCEDATIFEEFIQELDVDFSNDQDSLLDFSIYTSDTLNINIT